MTQFARRTPSRQSRFGACYTGLSWQLLSSPVVAPIRMAIGHTGTGYTVEDRVLDRYECESILKSMKIGERGQVTIPKNIREQFDLGPETEVEFRVISGSIVLKKAPRKLNLAKWKGHCGDAFRNWVTPQSITSSTMYVVDDHCGRYQYPARYPGAE